MSEKRELNEIKSAERRNFLRLTAAGSFTAAMVAGAAGMLWSDEAVAQTAKEEKQRQKAAKHMMTIATAYVFGASRSYPILQLDLKENIQNATNGKVYVKLAPGGQLGAGGALAQKVQGRHHPSSAAFAVQLRAFRANRRSDQCALFLRRQSAFR